jgi:hypothetical protein
MVAIGKPPSMNVARNIAFLNPLFWRQKSGSKLLSGDFYPMFGY